MSFRCCDTMYRHVCESGLKHWRRHVFFSRCNAWHLTPVCTGEGRVKPVTQVNAGASIDEDVGNMFQQHQRVEWHVKQYSLVFCKIVPASAVRCCAWLLHLFYQWVYIIALTCGMVMTFEQRKHKITDKSGHSDGRWLENYSFYASEGVSSGVLITMPHFGSFLTPA